jgi:hypothetical protein
MKYILMNKNTPVFEFLSDDDTVYALQIGRVFNEKYSPLAIDIDDGIANRSDFNNWLTGRRIPASRIQLKQGLDRLSFAANVNVTTAYLAERCFYLSLSDQYWVKPENSDLSWEHINFFTNDFSDDIGNALFDDESVVSPNLISPCNSSDGVLKKKWQIINDKRCLIKSGTGTLSQEVYNEQIANLTCELLGISNYTRYSAELMGGKPVSVCECFVNENIELITANDVVKHFLPDYRESPYNHYIKCCHRLGFDVTDSLDEMIVVDYVIGNTDRHYRNFGLLRDVNTLKIIGSAPLYDSGTALCHDIAYKLIDTSADIKSKPFMDLHSEQIKLVSRPERFDISNLKYLGEKSEDILSQFNWIPDERIGILSDLLNSRVEKLGKSLCKGYYNGTDYDDFADTPHKGRGR